RAIGHPVRPHPWRRQGLGRDPALSAAGGGGLRAAGTDVRLGNAGAGLGAKTAACKGGLGSVSAVDARTGITIGALVAANPAGSPVMPDGTFWAWPFEQDGEFGGRMPGCRAEAEPEFYAADPAAAGNTTIGVVATD